MFANAEIALQHALEQIKGVLAFLEKIKPDRKLRKEKEDLVAALNVFLQRSSSLAADKHSDARSSISGHGDVYDDVDHPNNQSGEIYNDVDLENNDQDVYTETAPEDQGIYDDTESGPQLPRTPTKSSPSKSATIAPISCEELKDFSMNGTLEIKREKNILKGAWQRRWCVLHRNILYMYDHAKDKKQKEAFSVSGYVVINRDDITKETKRKERCFAIKNSEINKTFDFCAPDKDCLHQWKQHFGQSNSSARLSVPDVPPALPSPTHGEKKPMINKFFTGIVSKIAPRTSGPNLSTSGNDIYDDTDVDGLNDIYDDAAIDNNYDDTVVGDQNNYDDTVVGDQNNYDDTVVPGGDDGLYTETAGETYEEFDTQVKKPPPTPTNLSHRPMPPPPVQSLALPPTPAGSQSPRNRSPTAGANTFAFDDSFPKLPPRSSKPRSYTTSPSPVPPQKDGDRESGSGTFRRSSLPHDADNRSLPPPPCELTSNGPINDGADASDNFDDVDIADLYQGMWDCMADDVNELPFKRGEVVHIISRDYDNYGWWTAKKNNAIGLVPKSYLMEAYEI